MDRRPIQVFGDLLGLEVSQERLVDALYAGRTEQFIETAVKFEDGRTGSVSATLKLLDAKTFPALSHAA